MTDRSSRPFWLGEDVRKWDHVRIHVQLYRDDRLGANEIAVYGGIACHAEIDTGEARPSKATLAKYGKISERAVYDSLRLLEESEYIAIVQRPGKASLYRLLPPPPCITPAYPAGVASSTAGQSTQKTATPAPPAGPLPGFPQHDPGTTFQTPRHQVPTN